MTQIADSLSLTDEKQSTIVVASGYLALLLSCVAFGIMFTPLKRTNTGDGFFVQWVECATVFVIGFIINVIRGFPPFQWIAAIAGALFATGNVLAVPVVNGLSMATALLLWGTLQIVIGWSVSRFGVPGLLAPTEVKHNALNYIGIFITVASGVLFVFVENSNEKSERSFIEVERSEWKDSDTTCDSDTSDAANKGKRLRRKLLYVFMAMLVGISNGLMVAAIEVLKQQHPPILFYQGSQQLDYSRIGNRSCI
ncbi:hypothetical protein KIN20_024954 [Parelaphostrongylus tenuis]|uniref:Uncharacterized protein n=1 Tax=Parelaphostrongylus tenuis TaxID=148309 RepID=A0AAD5NBI8_PARTN|nr:hypothetical protein KIN20_024954 [Parelaphostrongylus tenuis]